MANFSKSHPANLPGPLYTDTTCIDCGTCYHLSPEIFYEHEPDYKSIVIKQPHSTELWQEVKRAIISCPTNSIGVRDAPDIFNNLPSGLPLEIARDVFYLGHTSRDSFGATSYLVKTKEGNVLVDSPRFHPALVKTFEELGGVAYMFLTHQDDVADHQKFRDYFKLKRIIHKDDVSSDTESCEVIVEGKEDFYLNKDLKVIMTPGHSRGHMSLLYKSCYLFTGDHLFVENGHLHASRSVCWYSWSRQADSVKKLLQEKFEWVLPGHGGWGHFSVQDIQNELNSLVSVMKGIT